MSGRLTTTSPPQNPLGRRQHKLLTDLGYELVSRTGGGHYRYEHPQADPYDVSGTAYDRTAWQSFLSEMRKRHRESEHELLRPRKSARPSRPYRRRSKRTSVALLPQPFKSPEGIEQREMVPRPGSDEAVAQGCICGAYRNNHGVGIDGEPGVFAYAVGKFPCALHLEESGQQVHPTTDSAPRCPCGNKLPQRKRGRPRKWCFSCRPSKWDRMTDEQRDRSREAVWRWYSKQVEETA